MSYLTVYLKKGVKLEPQFYWNLGEIAQEKFTKKKEGLIARVGRGDDCEFQLAEPFVSWHQGEFHLLRLPSGQWTYVFYNTSKYGSGHASNLHDLPGEKVHPEGRLLQDGMWIFFPYSGSQRGSIPKNRAFLKYTEDMTENVPEKYGADAKSFGDTVVQNSPGFRIKK
ncbi:MAG: FHA domain-containing protein [Planctomycetota bacterium]